MVNIKSNSTIVSCNKYGICKNFLIIDNKSRCTVKGKKYFIKGKYPCDSCNIIYLITCSNCRKQYVGSAVGLKQRFRIHKSDIKSNKDRVRLQGILIINVAVLIINMFI